MITYAQAKALKVGDAVIVKPFVGDPYPTTVSSTDFYGNSDRLGVDNDAYQYILANCRDGIQDLSLPGKP